PIEMARQSVVGIADVDTRALTRHLRSAGVMRCGIFSVREPDGLPDLTAMLEKVRAAPPMAGADLAGEVTTGAAYVVPAVGAHRFTVAAVDLGLKAMTPHLLADRGITSHV